MKSRIGLSAVLAGFLAAAGCDSPSLPVPESGYDFRLVLPASGGGGGSVRTFHWPLGSTVEVIALDGEFPDRPSLGTALAKARRRWGQAAVFNEVVLRETSDPDRARAVLMWDDSEPLYSTPSDCTGPTTGAAATRGCLSDDRSGLRVWPRRDGGPSRLVFRVIINRAPGMDADFLETLVTHEMGHVLGILSHSQQPGDLMWAGPIESPALSERDLVTFRSLYQTGVDLSLP